MITQERLKELLRYDPETGVFTWVGKTNDRIRIGAVAGCVNSEGYWHVQIDGKKYKSHRLVWLYMTGAWPKNQTDHINGIRGDNRIENLREATNAENQQNRSARGHGKNGSIGVSWHKASGTWVASIGTRGRRKHIGCFKSIEDATLAYVNAKKNIHTFQPTPRGYYDVD